MTHQNLWLEGYRLTTAEIHYQLHDHPEHIHSFIWQDLDQAPNFPVLKKFLEFWGMEMDASLHSITIGEPEDVTPDELRHANLSLMLH